jgi:hypothetical protein
MKYNSNSNKDTYKGYTKIKRAITLAMENLIKLSASHDLLRTYVTLVREY